MGIGVILLLVVVEQSLYWWRKGSKPGPAWVWPFVGSLGAMVTDAYGFWHTHFGSSGPLAMDYLLGRPMMVVKDAKSARSVFENCSAERPLALHPNAVTLLATDNLAFLNGQPHRQIRKPLLNLFAPKPLASYLAVQERCIRSALQRWAKSNSDAPLLIRPLVFDLNSETSLRAFLGDQYVGNETKLCELQDALAVFTRGFLALPLFIPGTQWCLPGSQLYKARQARHILIQHIAHVSAQIRRSKHIETHDNNAMGLLENWIASGAAESLDDDHVAGVLLDLLFASQDASTSSLTNAVHYLCLNPDIVAKVRQESKLIGIGFTRLDGKTRDGKTREIGENEFTLDRLAEMPYVLSVAREVLRIRPPATIVPHVAATSGSIVPNKELKANEVVASGTLIVPSIWNANREGHPDPEKFDPERFDLQRPQKPPPQLTFGAGPHACIGQQYATNQLRLFIALLCHGYDFERINTPIMHDLVYAPTIFPADSCPIKFLKPRQTTFSTQL